MSSPTTKPLILATKYTAADRAAKARADEKHVKQLWIVLGSILAFLTFIRVVRLLSSWWRSTRTRELKANHDVEKTSPLQQRDHSSLRHLPAALGAAFRIAAFRYTVPIGFQAVASVSELSFFSLYIALIFAFLLVDTRNLQTMFFEDRAAYIASSQLPLIVALAGKNNVISILTGVSHERLNVLHRAASRTCLILLWMHAVSRTVLGLPKMFDFTHDWMRSGALGLVALSLAAFLSIRPIRQKAFELFLVTHMVLIAIFLVSGFVHARFAGFGNYIWPAMAIWGLDRVIRVLRLIYNNRAWFLGSSSPVSATNSSALAELITSDTVRITLTRPVSWKPGQHAYLTLPTISALPTEAHPFTIATIPATSRVSEGNQLVFLIRARAGLTERLREYVAHHGTTNIPACVDGPYGYPPNLEVFSTCILIAGGSGISYTLPLLSHLARESNTGKKSVVRRIVFVWAVRDGAHLGWISKALSDNLSSAGPALVIEPRVYITGLEYPIPQMAQTDDVPPSPASEKDSEKNLPLYSTLKLIHGRPSIRRLLEEEIGSSLGPVSVDVAGPAGLTQSVREALRSDIASPLKVFRGRAPVTLHVETFGMVKT